MKLKFENLIEDEVFAKKIRSNTSESKIYLEKLLKDYPEQKDEILFAAHFLKITNSDKKELSRNDASSIWGNIQKKHKNQSSNRFSLNKLGRIAAVVTILIGLGYYTYTQYQSISFRRLAQSTEIAENDAMLILSNGLEYKLENNDSEIRYDSNGENIIIAKADTTEQIANKKKRKEESLNQIIVPYGRRHSITLSDGTTVQLNSGSKLVYPANFNGNTRKVYLKGEGYFEVAKNKEIPFIVTTDYIDIRVTGTVFDVSAYDDEQTASTILVEGSVEVLQKNKLINNSKYQLAPGQGCFYSVKNAESTVSKVDLANYTGWKDGWLQFKDQPLIYITRKLEKYYNKNIVIEGEEFAHTLISGKLVLSDDFEEAMSFLSKTLEGKYEKNNKDIYIIRQ